MKLFSLPRSLAALALPLVASVVTSCSSTSTHSAAKQIDNASYTEVIGFNGAMAPESRNFVSEGALPQRVRDALSLYIKSGEVKTIEYAHPQYYIIVDNACWAICTDTSGKLTGIMAPKGGSMKDGRIAKNSDSRLRPTGGKYKVIYNTTEEAPVLEYEILKGLEPYDAYRKSIRTRMGLQTPAVRPPSKPAPVIKKPVAPVVTTTTPTTTATPAPAPAATEASEDATDTATDAASDETPVETTDEAPVEEASDDAGIE